MEEVYRCSQCGYDGTKKWFKTALKENVEDDEILCENCYDDLND